VMWPQTDSGAGAPGRALATYEDGEGRTKLAAPGSVLRVTDPQSKESQSWRVQAIRPDSVVLRNQQTGEETVMRAQGRSRAEQRYFGARGLSGQFGAQTDGVVPGRSTTIPQEGAAGGGGMGGMMGGQGMMGPGGPGGTMGPG
jgi:hypothetical protein